MEVCMNALEMVKERYSEESQEDWMEIKRHITSDPDVMDGLPVFFGTRIPVYIILDYLAEGMRVEDILKDYPGLDKEKIHAALKFANLLSSLH